MTPQHPRLKQLFYGETPMRVYSKTPKFLLKVLYKLNSAIDEPSILIRMAVNAEVNFFHFDPSCTLKIEPGYRNVLFVVLAKFHLIFKAYRIVSAKITWSFHTTIS